MTNWLSIASSPSPPTGQLGDELRVWLRDASPEDLWRVLREVAEAEREAIAAHVPGVLLRIAGERGWNHSPALLAEHLRARGKEAGDE